MGGTPGLYLMSTAAGGSCVGSAHNMGVLLLYAARLVLNMGFFVGQAHMYACVQEHAWGLPLLYGVSVCVRMLATQGFVYRKSGVSEGYGGDWCSNGVQLSHPSQCPMPKWSVLPPNSAPHSIRYDPYQTPSTSTPQFPGAHPHIATAPQRRISHQQGHKDVHRRAGVHGRWRRAHH